MGFFSFIKSAGAKIGIGSADEAPDAEALKKEIDKHGLGSENVEVEIVGDKAIIKGDVSDQGALEKIIIAAGNVVGIGSVETEVKTADADAKEPVFHTVVKGDTLSGIAKKTLGSANKYPAIFEANKPMLTHPDKIYPGQVLRIPQD